jgi:hypothetical protein
MFSSSSIFFNLTLFFFFFINFLLMILSSSSIHAQLPLSPASPAEIDFSNGVVGGLSCSKSKELCAAKLSLQTDVCFATRKLRNGCV